ncbi:hypothetical protein QFC24_004297 [Naganishia onofrii]|uniref:Uncharacterized protein n=1 Tax=Naganishia onofrii TaxID=1851511 RepID=A0ACC2XFB2_9TREE|nr:hypothetical protein QFC24_004297 [Naganishia onofrii]
MPASKQILVASLSALVAFASTAEAFTSGTPVLSLTNGRNHTCALQPKITSCENTTTVTADTCCTVNSLSLVTQFWTIYTGRESQGQVLPKSAWSAHGVWPDFCDGTYPQYCDLSRQYDPAPSPNKSADGSPIPAFTGGDISTPVLEYFGKYDLLAWANKYWTAFQQPNHEFWQHEYAKHATCFSSFDTGFNGTNNCYGVAYQEGEDIVDFYETVALHYLKYPTFDWLSAAKIVPSNTTTYKLKQFQDALTTPSGGLPYIGCSGNKTADGRTVISEVWYYGHHIGRVQDGNLKPIDAVGSNSSCSPTADLWYYERSTGSEA